MEYELFFIRLSSKVMDIMVIRICKGSFEIVPLKLNYFLYVYLFQNLKRYIESIWNKISNEV